MVVIDISTMKAEYSALSQQIAEPVLLRIQRGEEWKTEARMSEKDARDLASECRKRGLVAHVEMDHG